MEILFFGQLTDITKTSSIQMTEASDLTALKKSLFEKFPALSASQIMIAVNNKLVKDNIELNDTSVVAFRPPYSGG